MEIVDTRAIRRDIEEILDTGSDPLLIEPVVRQAKLEAEQALFAKEQAKTNAVLVVQHAEDCIKYEKEKAILEAKVASLENESRLRSLENLSMSPRPYGYSLVDKPYLSSALQYAAELCGKDYNKL